jgi:predicted lipoprotein with Yx(FWY)xxD motif
MTESRVHVTRAAVVAGALALLVSACGSGGSDSSSGGTGSSPGLVSTTSVDGTSTFADGSGKTLYSTDVEANGQIKCVESCTTFWEPLMATAKQAAQASTQIGEKFGVVDRPDGGSQLALDGLPLYTFAGEGAGELKGNGFTDDFQGTHFEWSAAGTEGSAAPSPSSAGGGGGYGY